MFDQDPSFLMTHIPELLDRFLLSYAQDCTCNEYHIYSREKHKEISRSLIVSHEVFSNSLYVSKFYPEIYKELNCKYLSAACFYLMVHHSAYIFHTNENCCVNLETDVDIFDNFYSRLDDFGFRILVSRPCQKVSLRGHYHSIPLGTEMIQPYLQTEA